MSKIYPVILCGGSGTRLWPKSRKSLPKPFIPLVGEQTLFEQAVGRCRDSNQFAAPLIVCGAAHLPHVESQLAGAKSAAIIVEPMARNTAAAIALAAHRLPADAVMLVCPSDHHIADEAAFRDAAARAASLAREGWLVSFGIEATAPETGYGYLKRGKALEGGFEIAQFVEKPDLERAKEFLANGRYSWNGGIFAFGAGRFLEELAAHRPEFAAATEQAARHGTEKGAQFHPNAEGFEKIEGESVDYAVMENTTRAAMVPASMGWSDIGNWQALHDAQSKDENGNAARGRAELLDCRNIQVDSDGPRVSVVGLEGVIVVVNGDEVLVTSAKGAQRVGDLNCAKNQ